VPIIGPEPGEPAIANTCDNGFLGKSPHLTQAIKAVRIAVLLVRRNCRVYI
jgi:hypothetical protein